MVTMTVNRLTGEFVVYGGECAIDKYNYGNY